MDVFYLDSSPQLEYIVFDAFHAAEIVVSGATQFQKMATWSQEGVLLDHSNNNWYAGVYHYYTNHRLYHWIVYAIPLTKSKFNTNGMTFLQNDYFNK